MSRSSRRFASKKKYCDSSHRSSARRKYHCGVSWFEPPPSSMSRRSDAISSRRLSETWTSTALRNASNPRAGPPGSFLAGFFASRVPPSAASGATDRFSPRSASRAAPRSARVVVVATSARATAPAASLRSIAASPLVPGYLATAVRDRGAGRQSLQPLVSVYENVPSSSRQNSPSYGQ